MSENENRAPLFTSFDEAWGWFTGGGEIGSIDRWRDRFTGGRAQLLSFQAPVDDDAVIDAVLRVQDDVADLGAIVPFSPEMLHVSIRGVGFQVIEKTRRGDVLRQEVERAGQAAAKIIAALAPVEVEIGPVNVFPDALVMEVHDGGRLGELRRALGDVVDDAFGVSDAQFLPHTTIGMFRAGADGDALRQRLPSVRERPGVRATMGRIDMARWWFTGIEPEDVPELESVRVYRLRG